jgi:hypothetical protein
MPPGTLSTPSSPPSSFLSSYLFICLPSSLPPSLWLHQQVLTDGLVMDEKVGEAEIKLDELGLDNSPLHEYMVKVNSRLHGRDARLYLNLAWQE